MQLMVGVRDISDPEIPNPGVVGSNPAGGATHHHQKHQGTASSDPPGVVGIRKYPASDHVHLQLQVGKIREEVGANEEPSR